MREILSTLAAVGLALLVIAGATFGAGDRATLVPPPDAVGENFTREVVEQRYVLALKYLAKDLRSRVTAEDLRRMYDPVRAGVGIPEHVDAEVEMMDAERAAARTHVQGSHGTAAMAIRFVRENGLWVVSELPQAAATVPPRE